MKHNHSVLYIEILFSVYQAIYQLQRLKGTYFDILPTLIATVVTYNK